MHKTTANAFFLADFAREWDSGSQTRRFYKREASRIERRTVADMIRTDVKRGSTHFIESYEEVVEFLSERTAARMIRSGIPGDVVAKFLPPTEIPEGCDTLEPYELGPGQTSFYTEPDFDQVQYEYKLAHKTWDSYGFVESFRHADQLVEEEGWFHVSLPVMEVEPVEGSPEYGTSLDLGDFEGFHIAA